MQVNALPAIPSEQSLTTSEQKQQSSNSNSKPVALKKLDDKSRFETVLEDGNEIVYRAVDPDTGMVLAEVPSEEIRRVGEALAKFVAQGKIK